MLLDPLGHFCPETARQPDIKYGQNKVQTSVDSAHSLQLVSHIRHAGRLVHQNDSRYIYKR